MEIIKGCSSGVPQHWHYIIIIIINNNNNTSHLYMVAVLKLVGTSAWARDRLKMFVKTLASCSARALSTWPGIPSGPAAFCLFTLLRVEQTPQVESVRGCSSGGISASRITSLSPWSKRA